MGVNRLGALAGTYRRHVPSVEHQSVVGRVVAQIDVPIVVEVQCDARRVVCLTVRPRMATLQDRVVG